MVDVASGQVRAVVCSVMATPPTCRQRLSQNLDADCCWRLTTIQPHRTPGLKCDDADRNRHRHGRYGRCCRYEECRYGAS